MNIYGYSPFGYEGSLVTVEVDLRRGIPAVDIVGIADGAVKESRERMKSAIKNSGFEFPLERVLISLFPADLKKEGAGFDLLMAMSVLKESNKELFPDINVLVIGELELSGKVRQVKGIEVGIASALENGIEYFIIPKGSKYTNVENAKILEVESLKEAFVLSQDLKNFNSCIKSEIRNNDDVVFTEIDDSYSTVDLSKFLNNHSDVARAIEIAVAGKHNMLLTGSPGCGKTLILQMLVPMITPELTEDEIQSVRRIKSITGLDYNFNSYKSPFRMPHQTSSIEGMCGGGVSCRPGEISLAHNGVLFLDEAAEFRSSVLQMLRVPIKTGNITLSRAGRSTVFPANFQLFLASNPCPCGNYGSSSKICLCNAHSVEMYWKKFSAPLLDRIEIKQFMEETEPKIVDIDKMKERIKKAFMIQRKRGIYNKNLNGSNIDKYCLLKDGKQLSYYLRIDKLSKRNIDNLLKVSLTIANLEGRELIEEKDLEEAMNLISLNEI